MKAIKRIELKNIPFDREGYHATGCSIQLENGEWLTEYEDCIYEDADSCQYFDEREWDE